MRLRFSLRTLLLGTVLVSAICYVWFVLPSTIARRFAEAIAAEEYERADRYFLRSDARFLADSAEKYWAFRLQAAVLPGSLGQALRGQRYVHLNYSYFHLDHHLHFDGHVAATPFGLKPMVISRSNQMFIIIDRNGGRALLRQ